MKFLNTKHKRKSAVITLLILMLLVFGIVNYGMQYLDPPEEYGLAINFGDANFGSGDPVVTSKKEVPNKVIEKQEVVEEVKDTPKEIIKEKVITQETSKEVPVVDKVKEIPKKEPTKEIQNKEKVKEIVKPKPSKETQDALNKLLNGNSDRGDLKGEGDDVLEGVKGKNEGDINASKYYGNTGNGSGGDYNLSGRKALSKPKEQPNCQEEGIVVVKITVDNAGKVITATAGVKGSTNTASCLLKPAKNAALNTKWNADKDAPKIQTGTIIYRFTLTK